MTVDTYTGAFTLRHAEPAHRQALRRAARDTRTEHRPQQDAPWMSQLGGRVTVEEGIGTRRRPADPAEQRHRIKTAGEEFCV
jgi:hypothetical protein